MRQQNPRDQTRLSVELEVAVEGDGQIGLRWRTERAGAELGYQLLVIRSGASPAYTALRLAHDLDRYTISGLSRHQRYLCAVLASSAGGSACSPWQSVTPKLGLEPRKEPGEGIDALGSHLGRVRRLTVMPQDRRLTAFWERSPGFADEIRLEVLERGRVQKRLTLEPEVASISLDASRGVRLSNGGGYLVRVASSFAGIAGVGESVLCTPAPQGQERAANRAHPQQGLVYPFLDLGPELQVFDDEAPPRPAASEAAILCHSCRAPVRWQSYRLICTGCGAEFIPTGRGDYLEASRLRFGTCRCCLPKKILIQRVGSESLACSCSAEPTTPVETGRIADLAVRCLFELPRPAGERSPWFRRIAAEGTSCLIGGNQVEPGSHGELAYGIRYPGQVVRLGLGDLHATDARQRCEVCGRVFPVRRREPALEASSEELDQALLD
jgi:hypothetical protein